MASEAARASRADRPRSRAAISTASRGVNPSIGAWDWGWIATARRAAPGSATASMLPT